MHTVNKSSVDIATAAADSMLANMNSSGHGNSLITAANKKVSSETAQHA